MNSSETILTITEAGAFAFAALAVAREAVRNNWVKLSVTVSLGVVPLDKRFPAPKVTAARAPRPEDSAEGAADAAPAPSAVPDRRAA